MRTFVGNQSRDGNVVYNVTMKYPDEVAFAFNPFLFIIEEANLASASVTIRNEEVQDAEVTVTRDAYHGKVYIDAREVVQSLFDIESLAEIDYEQASRSAVGRRLSFTHSIKLINGEEYQFEAQNHECDIFCIWGALRIGGQEVYNAHRTLTWYKNFPFTFGMFSNGGGSVLICKDGVADRFINLGEQGVWNIPLLASDKAKNYFLVQDCTGQFVEMTFDRTFDMTFRYSGGGNKTEKIRINVDESDEGVYLRWVDRFGFFNYHLFKRGNEKRKTTAGEYMQNNLAAYDMSYGYQGTFGRRQKFERKDELAICAPLVDSDMWDILFDITTSPIVDVFAGYEGGVPRWMSVTVNGGTFTKTGAALQDFELSVNLPEVVIQSF